MTPSCSSSSHRGCDGSALSPSSSLASSQKTILKEVASELEGLRSAVGQSSVGFPVACRSMLYSLSENGRCMDCGCPRPEWASVTYGILLCVTCSGRHRSYGVQVSRVRSIDMDDWSQEHVLKMLEGSNGQLSKFFDRHHMSNDFDTMRTMTSKRYHTKAALFYRSHLQLHAEELALGVYQGREASRVTTHQHQSQSKAMIHAGATKTTTASTAKTASGRPLTCAMPCNA